MPASHSATLRSLVVSSHAVRRSIGWIGILLPIVLAVGGWAVYGIAVQDNISTYYHTPLRDLFVGCLSAIGVFLFCYQGQDAFEGWTANGSALAAFGLAFFPIDPHVDPLYQQSLTGFIHSLSGGVFFTTLAVFSLWHFNRPEESEQADEKELTRRFIYYSTGIVLLGSTAAMGGYLLVPASRVKTFLNDWNTLFWLESIAIWAFATAWLTKGHAIIAEVGVAIVDPSLRRAIEIPLKRSEERR